MKLKNILSAGIDIRSSGTTGVPKTVFQPPSKLAAANSAAIDSQKITSKSRIYTVCKIEHAGGLLAQTLPAYSIGSDVVIEKFNAYRWLKEIHKYSHTHLTPRHCLAIMKTKEFWNSNLSNIWITCGSDPVTWDIIESFVNRGCVFMANWGMTEVGPCAINTVFSDIETVKAYKTNQISEYCIMGDRAYVDYKIINDELYVNGDICVYNDWFPTGDLAEKNNNGTLYYRGRK